jgi:glutamine synthetase
MQKITAFFKQNPTVEMIEAFIVDVNGVLRGKWLPRQNIEKMLAAGMHLPRSAFAVDIWGNDVIAAGLITETGDSDGVCFAVADDSLKMVPWLERPTAQVMLGMQDENGKAFFGDPRQVLAHILSLYKKAGLTPVVAAELEFYLLDCKLDERGAPQPPLSPLTGRRAHASQTYGISEAGEFRKTLAEINRFCHEQNIPADTTISENGPCQYEINLCHVPDALLAADHATLMKRVVKGVAQSNGMNNSFMAKPYADQSGSGMHVHFSILDAKGKNIFAGKTHKGTPALHYALGGLLATMAESIAVLAPNANSYHRFQAGSHAPTKMTWGYDNRSASLRVPESELAATRIEHRVAGADVNPYLALAVILGGALYGIEHKIKPPAATTGSAYQSKAKTFPTTWETALAAFEESKFIDRYLGKKYKKLYLACKRQEKELLERAISSAEHDAYLRSF